MIEGFKNETAPLSEYERITFLPLIADLLRRKVGISNATKNKDIVRWMMENYRISITEVRVRKIINHIRNNDIIPCLIATRSGYYVAEERNEVDMYIQSLKGRIAAITHVADSLCRQRGNYWVHPSV